MTDSADAGRMKTKKTVSKKRIAKNSVANNNMITTLARGLGHTAGVIVRATQRFGASVNVIPSDVTENVARAPARRSAAARKKRSGVKPVTQRSQKRSATAAAVKTKRRTT